jgi:hypothetical protein
MPNNRYKFDFVNCPICGERRSYKNLKRHLKAHKKCKSQSDTEFVFNCQFCGKKLQNLNALRQHEIRCAKNPNRLNTVIPNFNNRGRKAWNDGLTFSEEYKATTAQKRRETNNLRKSWNTSKPEQRYYEFLLTKYAEDDIIKQYRDQERYPFYCDFYIKSEDKFIECNFHWTHGGHPFDSTNREDLALLNTWQEKAKTSIYYSRACYIWTDLDPRKRQYANEKHLNYEIIWKF